MTNRSGLLLASLIVIASCGTSSEDGESDATPTPVKTIATSTTSMPTTSAAPTTTTEPRSILATDARLTPVDQLADPNECKIADITPNRDPGSSGFPRNPNGADPLDDLDVLVVPLSVEDSVFDDSDLELVDEMLSKASDYFFHQSYGRVTINPTIAPRESWASLPGTAESTGLSDMTQFADKAPIYTSALSAVADSLDLTNYDAVAVYTHKDERFFFGQGVFAAETPDGPVEHGVFMGGMYNLSWEVLAHELIHAWLLSEDLYLFSNPGEPTMGGWDIMVRSISPNIEINSWTRWINSWITDTQVRCIAAPGQSVHYLETISMGSDENKMVVVRLSDHSVLVLDSRRQFEFGVTGYDSNGSAVLAYVVDTSIPHGEGPFRWRGELRNVGDTVATDGVTITLLDADDTSDLVSVEVG